MSQFKLLSTTIIDLFIIMIGIIGIIGGLLFSLNFPQRCLIGLGLLIIYGWILYFYKKKQLSTKKVTFVLMFFIGFILMTFFQEFITVVLYVIDVIVYDYFLSFDVIFVSISQTNILLENAVFMMMFFSIVHLIISFMTQEKHHLIKMFIFLLLYAFPVLIRHELHNYTSYCFILLIIYGYIFRVCQKNELLLKQIVLVSLSVLLVLSHIYLEPNSIFGESSTTVLTNITKWIDFDNIGFHQISGTSYDIEGDLPTNNVLSNNRLALTIESEPFTSYIKGYALGEYGDNQWDYIQETPYQESDTILLHYLSQNDGYSEQYKINIESTKDTKYQFYPYGCYVYTSWISDSYYEKGNKPLYRKDFEITADEFTQKDVDDFDYYWFVKENYMNVPNDLKAELQYYLVKNNIYSHAEPNDYQAIMEVADEVRSLIHRDTKYTLKCGSLPKGEDFVSYFLFENQKGSCSHYATSGALLLRCLGIPTRYVKGYVVYESDFKDGVAKINSNRSHSWIEIYVKGKGWIPYEMTFNAQQEDDNNTQTSQDTDVIQPPRIDNNTNQENTTTPTTQQNQGNTTVDNHYPLMQLVPYLLGLIFIVVFMSIYRLITHHLFYIRLKKKNNNQKAIDYYVRLSKAKGTMNKDIEKLVYKAKFSQHVLSDEEILTVENEYSKAISTKYHSLPLYKKLIFEWIKGYK